MNDKTAPPSVPLTPYSAYPDKLSRDEQELLRLRREERPVEREKLLGIGVSGGGVRSATFALGVWQALAAEKEKAEGPTLLREIDYLSTVSGGGYFGGFYGALFHPRGSEGRRRPDPNTNAKFEKMKEDALRGLLSDAIVADIKDDERGKLERAVGELNATTLSRVDSKEELGSLFVEIAQKANDLGKNEESSDQTSGSAAPWGDKLTPTTETAGTELGDGPIARPQGDRPANAMQNHPPAGGELPLPSQKNVAADVWDETSVRELFKEDLCHQVRGKLSELHREWAWRDTEAKLSHNSPHVRYLRENGRYLAPAGSCDLWLGAAVLTRNWVAVTLVLLALVVLGSLGVELLFYWLSSWPAVQSLLAERIEWGMDHGLLLSPLMLPTAAVAFFLLPLGWAYFLVGSSVFVCEGWGWSLRARHGFWLGTMGVVGGLLSVAAYLFHTEQIPFARAVALFTGVGIVARLAADDLGARGNPDWSWWRVFLGSAGAALGSGVCIWAGPTLWPSLEKHVVGAFQSLKVASGVELIVPSLLLLVCATLVASIADLAFQVVLFFTKGHEKPTEIQTKGHEKPTEIQTKGHEKPTEIQADHYARYRISTWLRAVLLCTLVLAFVTLVHTAGRTVYVRSIEDVGWLLSGVGALAAALASGARKMLVKSDQGKKNSSPKWIIALVQRVAGVTALLALLLSGTLLSEIIFYQATDPVLKKGEKWESIHAAAFDDQTQKKIEEWEKLPGGEIKITSTHEHALPTETTKEAPETTTSSGTNKSREGSSSGIEESSSTDDQVEAPSVSITQTTTRATEGLFGSLILKPLKTEGKCSEEGSATIPHLGTQLKTEGKCSEEGSATIPHLGTQLKTEGKGSEEESATIPHLGTQPKTEGKGSEEESATIPHLGTQALVVWVGLLLFSLAVGWLRRFLNNSSHLALYSSRITRAFLGASNLDRIRQGDSERIGQGDSGGGLIPPTAQGKGATHLKPGDDLELRDYFGGGEGSPYAKGAPLHLINITINETVDGRSQSQEQDRRGVGMVVGPCGLSVGVRHHAVFDWGRQTKSKGNGGQKGDSANGVIGRFPIPNIPNIPKDDDYFVFGNSGPAEERELGPGKFPKESLSLGQWLGVSGAAFTTGLGSRTNVGLSLLLGLANVRLGHWWESGARPKGRWYQDVWKALLWTQQYLLRELFARFPGTAHRLWYLSDGGHFENMGGYELIRRRLRRIVIIDGEADPETSFEGLANLVRKARLDFGVEIEFLEEHHLKDIRLEEKALAGLAELKRDEKTGWAKAHAALARVIYPAEGDKKEVGWLLYVKPTLRGTEPIDILNYHSQNPSFPQQSTSDQFFDETQWESYRRLGEHIGRNLVKKGSWPLDEEKFDEEHNEAKPLEPPVHESTPNYRLSLLSRLSRTHTCSIRRDLQRRRMP